MPRIAPSLVFNELSIPSSYAQDRATMLTWMGGLVEVLKTAYDRGIQSFRTGADFRKLPLMVDGYTIQRWCDDDGYDIDYVAQEFLLDYFTRDSYIKPQLADLPEFHIIKRRIAQGFISGYEGVEAVGLGYAYLLQHVAISFQSDECWNTSIIKLERLESTDDGGPDVVDVKHADRVTHLDTHHPKRQYDGNLKHPESGDDEAFIAIMNLDSLKAQQALFEGVQPDGMDEIFSYFEGRFYVFRPHRANVGLYHGYLVKMFRPVHKKRVLKAMLDAGVLDQHEYRRYK